MRRPLSKITGMGTAAALVLALAACGGETETPESGDGGGIDPASLEAELTWWDTSDATNEGPVFEKLIAKFNEKYPNVQIDYQSVPFGEAQNKFKNAAKAESGAPDILRAEVAWVPEFASLGYLYALDGTDLVADQDEFLDAPVSSTQFDGKTYGVPQVTDSLALMYNKELLEEAGVEVPRTWDEMAEAAAKIKSATGKDGAYLNPQGYFMLPFLYGEGGDLLDPEQQQITVADDAAVAGAQQAADLLDKPGFVKPPATDAYTAMMKNFTGGKVAMIINGPWEVKNITGTKAFGGADNLGIAPVPAGSERAGAPVGGHDYVVWSGMPEEKADAAIAFIKFMSSEESQVTIANELGLLPTRAEAYAKVDNPVVGEFNPVMEVAVPRAWIPEGGQLFAPMDEAATEIMVQGKDPQTVLDEVAKTYKSEVVPDYS